MTGRDVGGAAQARDLALIQELARAKDALEARLLIAAEELLARVGSEVLALKGFVSVEQLTPSQRRKWRAHTKAVSRMEVEVATGCSASEARHLIGIASSPVGVRRLLIGALERGEASGEQIRAFWRRAGSLPWEAAEVVAETLFGTEAALAAPERLDTEGRLSGRSWMATEYTAALYREVTRAQGADVQAERERRRAAYQARTVEIVLGDDGSAVLTLEGATLSICAIHQRLDRAARLLRKHGDPRTLPQLRSDIAAALLIHGVLPAADPAGEGALDDVTVPGLDRLGQIMNALPDVELQVVVPWDALTGQPSCASCQSRRGTGPPLSPQVSDRSVRDGGRPDVGELIGHHPAFLSPSHVREMALLPGTTFRRLLVDPADGRLIERGSTVYRPDAATRRHVLATDLYSRAPGSRRPGAVCELDHVHPWGVGGLTTESNLVTLDKRYHQLKTAGLISSAIGVNRDLTWTTVLGQVAVTRAHDYRQYSPSARHRSRPSRACGTRDVIGAVHGLAPLNAAASGTHPSQREDLWHRRDLINRALYAALAERAPRACMEARDDLPGAVEHDGALTDWLRITHTTSGGARRRGPAPDSPTLAEVLGLVELSPTLLAACRNAPWRHTDHPPPPF